MPPSQPIVVPVLPAARVAAALACALWLALGCSETTHTVGQVRGVNEDPEQPSSPGRAGSGEIGSGAAGSSGSASAGAGAGTNSGFGTSDDAGISGSPPPDWDAALECGAEGTPAVRRRLDLYLIVDNNFTIQLPPAPLVAWDNLLRGIHSYVERNDAVGTGVGVKYFGTDCSTGAYARPDVEVQPLPGNMAAIQSSLERVAIINASPMVYALEGALTHAKSRASSYDYTKQAVVVISDGYTTLWCQPSGTTAPDAAANGLADYPSTPTYVIALDLPELTDLLNPQGRLDALDAIAREGGTGQARRIDLLDDSTDAFVDAMLDVQHDAESCDYAVPQLVRDEPGRLSLGLSDPSGLPAALPLLSDSSACGEGYYMDAAQEWVTLCPSACAEVKETRANLVWFTDC